MSYFIGSILLVAFVLFFIFQLVGLIRDAKERKAKKVSRSVPSSDKDKSNKED